MHVLIVEDEIRLASALRQGLEAEGFGVELAHTGPEGIEAARRGRFDAIVCDIMLPGVSGYRVCSTLRDEGDWTPMLMLTAKDGEWDEAEALDTGADDYVTKPFSLLVLVARLRALVRRHGRSAAAPLRAGDLVVDVGSRHCRRGDEEVSLSAREFALLAALLRRRGVVVSKEELLRDVWGPDFEGDPNIVEVYVGYLRRKIDAPFGREAIRTVRGAGYRLEEDGG